VRRAELVVGSAVRAAHDTVTGGGPDPVHRVPDVDGEARGSERQAVLPDHDGVGLRGGHDRGRWASGNGRGGGIVSFPALRASQYASSSRRHASPRWRTGSVGRITPAATGRAPGIDTAIGGGG